MFFSISFCVFVLCCVLIGALYYSWMPPTNWCKNQRCLIGKTALITGANTGLGYATAVDFAKRGARVILGCRDPKRGEDARRKIIEETDNDKIVVKIVDMSSFESVRKFATSLQDEERLDILVNNAGISFGYNEKTDDGYDLVMQVNYYSHFLLTHLLIGRQLFYIINDENEILDLMKKSGQPSRIVNISSLIAASVKNFSLNKLEDDLYNYQTYANSKLCNILFTKELAKKLQNTNISTYSLHPGAIQTEIFRRAEGLHRAVVRTISALFFKSLDSGIQTIIYCSLEKKIEKFSGQHFDNSRIVNYKAAQISGLPPKLWKMTEGIVNLKDYEKLNTRN